MSEQKQTSNVRPSILWWRDKDKNLQTIPFIGVIEENHSASVEISKYPVQQGFTVSKNAIRHNRKISIKVLTPDAILGGIDPDGAVLGNQAEVLAAKFGLDLGGYAPIAGGILADPFGVAGNYLDGMMSAAQPVVSGIASGIDSFTDWYTDGKGTDYGDKVGKYFPTNSRRIQTFRQLEEIRENGYFCSLSTLMNDYNNLIMTNLDTPTTIETAHTAVFNITFEEVIVVDAEGDRVTTLNPDELSDEDIREANSRADKLNNPEDDVIGDTLNSAKDSVTDFGKSLRGKFA